jgi:succinoglycan biosynthesis transport protein ExoP
MVIELTTPGIVYVLFRQRWVIVGFLSFCLFLAVAYCVIATSKYQADAAVVVNFSRQITGDTSADRGGANQPSAAGADEIINSYGMVLQSDALAEQVINEVGLAKIYPYLARPPSALGRAITGFWEFFGVHSKTPMESAVYRFAHSDTKIEVPKDSTVIQITLYNPDPEAAKRALSVMIDRFLERQAQIGRDPQLSFVQDQVTFYKKKVTDAQAAMEAFQLKNKISSMDEENSYLLKQRSDLETQLAGNKVRIEEDQRRSGALQEQLKTLTQTVDLHQQDRDAALDAARTQLVELQVRQQSLSTSFGPDSPAARVNEAQIAKVQSFIDSYPSRTPLVQMAPNTTYQTTQTALLQTQADLQGALKSQPVIQSQIDAISARLAERAREQSTYQDLVREYQVDDENYRTYLQAVQQARIAVDLNKERGTTVAVYQPAHMASSVPTKPKRKLIIAGGIVLGLLLGFSAAFLRESWDERLNTPRQVNALLGLPLLGAMGDFARPALLPGWRR